MPEYRSKNLWSIDQTYAYQYTFWAQALRLYKDANDVSVGRYGIRARSSLLIATQTKGISPVFAKIDDFSQNISNN